MDFHVSSMCEGGKTRLATDFAVMAIDIKYSLFWIKLHELKMLLDIYVPQLSHLPNWNSNIPYLIVLWQITCKLHIASRIHMYVNKKVKKFRISYETENSNNKILWNYKTFLHASFPIYPLLSRNGNLREIRISKKWESLKNKKIKNRLSQTCLTVWKLAETFEVQF